MEFEKYSKIENSYRERALEKCKNLGISSWVALEKLDGSGLSFIVDKHMKVTPTSRNQIIPKESREGHPKGFYGFMGCNDVVHEHIDKMRAIAHLVGEPVQVYGEFYGQGVQKRINYGEKDFRVFDIRLAGGTFLSWPYVKILCWQSEVETVPEIASGSLDKLLELTPELPSQICDDAAEGLVIKPSGHLTVNPEESRPILKVKSKKFSEKSGKKKEKPVQGNTLSQEDIDTYQKLSVYICEERLGNVLSKLGTLTSKDFGKATGLLVQDAKEDFEADNGEISKDVWTAIKRDVSIIAMEVVRKDWANTLERHS